MKDPRLVVARSIGSALVESAFWSGQTCTWVGPLPGVSSRSWGTIGPDLYDGAAGIGLFLATLSRLTREREFAETALAALRFSLVRMRAESAPVGGYYLGWLGALHAITLTAQALGEEDVMAQAAARARVVMESPVRSPGFDVMSGLAGDILASLGMATTTGEDVFVDGASAMAEELSKRASVVKGTLSWSTRPPWPAPLTGLSHGTAGVGLAFLRLFQATAMDCWVKAADRAFAYERRWFDQEHQNWPDFRWVGRRRGSVDAFACAWCHGAPGIALSRLVAWQITGESLYRTEAEIALATTARMAETWLERGHGDRCLCHGWAGNAQILGLGARLLTRDDLAGLAQRMAAAVTESIPSANPGDPTVLTQPPGLFTGAAGVGMFLLQGLDQSVPDVMCPPMV